MNLQLVSNKPQPFIVFCCRCLNRVQTDRKSVYADLDSASFHAYYCADCVTRTVCGTSWFRSKLDAIRYYTPYHYTDTVDMVSRKIREGEISIGLPAIGKSQFVFLIDENTRYAIEDLEVKP